MNNEDRTIRAERALDVYRGMDTEDECHYQDIITDVLHAAREQGLDLSSLVRCAVRMYDDEIDSDLASVLFVEPLPHEHKDSSAG